METHQEAVLDVAKKALVEAVEPARAVRFGEAQDQRNLSDERRRCRGEALGDGRNYHAQELLPAAARLLEGNRRTDEPLTREHEGRVDESSDSDTHRRAGPGRIEADSGDHSGTHDRDGVHASSSPRRHNAPRSNTFAALAASAADAARALARGFPPRPTPLTGLHSTRFDKSARPRNAYCLRDRAPTSFVFGAQACGR